MKEETLDEAAEAKRQEKYIDGYDSQDAQYDSFIKGYNKSQETHPFTEKDIIDFAEWLTKEDSPYSIMYGGIPFRFATNDDELTIEQLMEIWKKQKPKIIFYE